MLTMNVFIPQSVELYLWMVNGFSCEINCIQPSFFFLPYHSQKWLTCNFSLQYQYIVKQRSDENIENYQLGVILI